MSKRELYQNHGDHIDAIMPTAQFMKDYLQRTISDSKVLKKVRSEVTAEDMDGVRTDVFSLVSGDGDMAMLTLLAYSPKSKTNYFMSIYPTLRGRNYMVKIEDVIEWDNQVEATVICSVGDFEFAFFATDYYANKRSYCVGDTLSIEIAALGCKVEEAERGFTFEGQKAIDWLAKIGKQPTYDEQGNVEPIRFSTEKLVAFFNSDDKCPDEAQFQSPISNLSTDSLLEVPFYKGDVSIHRDEDDNAVGIPLYFRKDFVPSVKNSDPLRGWMWLIGKIYDNNDRSHQDIPTNEQLALVGEEFTEAIEDFDFERFDEITPLLKPLDKIALREGYVLDAFKVGDKYGSTFQLYTCRRDAISVYEPYTHRKDTNTSETDASISPYRDTMWISGLLDHNAAKNIPSVFTNLSIPFTKMGIWQAYLLYIAPSLMPKDWHGGYGARSYIFNLNELRGLPADCSKYYDDMSLLPQVRIIDDNNAQVVCSYWNSWVGLSRVVVNVTRDWNFEDTNREVLVKHDCGIIF